MVAYQPNLSEGLNNLSIPDLNPSPLWYISKNGNDSLDCGRNVESACATFLGLWLHLVDGSTHGKNIRILADTDLLIENMHLCSPDHQFTFKNLPGHVIDIKVTNTTVEDTKLTFNGDHISVRIENSLIQSSPMHSEGLSKSVTTANNSRSSVFKLLSFKGTNVQLYRTHFTGIKGYRTSMLCSESNMTMMDVSANGLEGDFKISKQCNVEITNSHFTENTKEN